MFHFRVSSMFLFSLLITASFALTGCDENCDDCQAAIDHMYGKLPDFSCNAGSMGEAVQRINDNCNKEGQNAAYIVNCAVELCGGLSASPPFCESPGVGIPYILALTFSTGGTPVPQAELVLKLKRNGETVEQKSLFLAPGSYDVLADWQYNDGDILTAQLYDTSPVPEELSPVAEFDMRVRSQSLARLVRSIVFGHSSATNNYTLEAQYF